MAEAAARAKGYHAGQGKACARQVQVAFFGTDLKRAALFFVFLHEEPGMNAGKVFAHAGPVQCNAALVAWLVASLALARAVVW